MPTEAPIAALVLAAGASRRMGGVNKLLMPVAGEAMARRVAAVALGAGARPVVAVLGHQAAAVADVLADLDVATVTSPRPAAGMGLSIATGMAALPAGTAGVLICLADMPWVREDHLERLMTAFDERAGHTLCVPTWQGRRGNPVLAGRGFFAHLAGLDGEAGARRLIESRPAGLREVPMDDDAVHRDVDTPADLAG